MRKNDSDTKLIIYRSRQVFIMLCVMLLTAVFGVILTRNEAAGYSWYAVAIPIIGIGLTMLAVPPSEEWEYKPWQSKARRIEQQER